MEAGLIILLVVVAATIGAIVGIRIERARWNNLWVKGVLYVNANAPEGQGLFLEQLVPTNEIAATKHVVFETRTIDKNSHE